MLATLGIGLLNLEKFTLGAIGYLFLVFTPYLFAIYLTTWSTSKASILISLGVSFILALGGVFLIVDAMYIHPDAQGALVFPVVAVYQWAILLIILLPLYFLNKKA
ncbi:hypothetical protein [Sulfurovum riftiae]|nr:hypothetical protein [Sulfurovum riftiae]